MARALFCVFRTGVLVSECYVNACETIIMSANGTWIRKQKLGNIFLFLTVRSFCSRSFLLKFK